MFFDTERRKNEAVTSAVWCLNLYFVFLFLFFEQLNLQCDYFEESNLIFV